MSDLSRGPGLRGRRRECETLDRLLDGTGANRSHVLVLRGEAGVGKTALLDYVAGKAAASCRVARVAGVESEMELAFAALHQMCAPMLDGVSRLPGPQHDALSTAFGLRAGEAPDRFLVGLAVLSLLSDVAEERPLVCLVDDVQWLDRASAQVLAFVARRLLAEAVALVFAIREADQGTELAGLPSLMVEGLNDADARALLESALRGRLDEGVRDRFLAEARGNPLALVELPRAISAAELAGGFGLPDAVPLASRIEQSFVRRLQSLPAETQRLLLVAAAEPLGDVALLARAAAGLGLALDAAVPAAAAGLIEVGTRVRFTHPLVRSAVYRSGGPAERRAAHRALGAATDPVSDPDRRAWHLAHAAVGPDEAVAAELEQSAERAKSRGGVAAAAAFLERAAELTPDPARRGARALAAAQGKFEAAAPDAAARLLSLAELGPLNDLQQARATRLRAQMVFARSRGNDAPAMLLDAARRLEGLDDGLARETYLEAFAAAVYAGRLSRQVGVREVAEAARAAPRGSAPPRPIDLLVDGMTTRFIDGAAAGLPLLERALRVIMAETGTQEEDLRWMWLTSPAAFEVWDDEAWDQLTVRAVRVSRESGSLSVLRVALAYRAGVLIHAGDFAGGSGMLEEADAISVATGHAPVGGYAWQVLAAWQGDEGRALRLTAGDARSAAERGEGRVIGMEGYTIALLYNGLGRYQAALASAQRSCEHEDLGLFGWYLVELIEAAARSGAHETAHEARGRLEAHAIPAGTDWALGTLARSSALLSEGPAADALYREAIDRLGRSRVAVQLARAHLVYGEWLRRENRRVEAREQLRTAHDRFSGMGAEGFAERARRELLATGETVRKRSARASDLLTAQEAQVARLAAEGRTNPEIAGQLFISPRTAEYHLHKVYAKLGISSRRELRGALAAHSK